MQTLWQDLRYRARMLQVFQLSVWLGLLLLSNTTLAQQKAGDLKFEPYPLENREKQPVAAELGRLWVPENRRKAGSRLIELAFVRLKSTASMPGAPIIYLEGGPGGAGTAALRGPAFGLMLALREAGDVILLDQRGTGLSKPTPVCQRTWDLPLDQAANPATMSRLAVERVKACAEDMRRQGFDLAGYNTAESADDIEAMRVALGVKKVRLWGISYGTHLALAMIRRHAGSVERAVLTGVSGPDHALLKLPETVQQQLINVGALINADAEMSKLIPDLPRLVTQLLDQLDRNPVTVEIANQSANEKNTVIVGKWDLQFFAASPLTQTWGIAAAPGYYYALAQGDFSALGKAALGMRRAPIGSMMAVAMVCASGVSESRQKTIQSTAPQTAFGNAINFPFPEVCAALPRNDLGNGFRAPIKSSVPVLFISGTLDGRTPVGNAEAVLKGFPNSRHLVIEGASHGYDLFYFFPRSQEILTGFLQGRPVATERISILPLRFNPVNPATNK